MQVSQRLEWVAFERPNVCRIRRPCTTATALVGSQQTAARPQGWVGDVARFLLRDDRAGGE
jgi:hypothetical protein